MRAIRKNKAQLEGHCGCSCSVDQLRAEMDETAAFKIVSPFIWLATIAFLVGFVGYLASGGVGVLSFGADLAKPEMTSGPASDDWNIPKQI
jgi:hypothetical protein